MECTDRQVLAVTRTAIVVRPQKGHARADIAMTVDPGTSCAGRRLSVTLRPPVIRAADSAAMVTPSAPLHSMALATRLERPPPAAPASTVSGAAAMSASPSHIAPRCRRGTAGIANAAAAMAAVMPHDGASGAASRVTDDTPNATATTGQPPTGSRAARRTNATNAAEAPAAAMMAAEAQATTVAGSPGRNTGTRPKM